eukprot:Nk52_evm3s290 gene=Nk52_evmTU3s290
MWDNNFTLISGSTCIVVLLMLLARTDAAPQVGEIDAMQETVTGAPSDSPIFSVYQVGFHTSDWKINCMYDVDSSKCKLQVASPQKCHIQLAKGQAPACKKPNKPIVSFTQVASNRLKMEELDIDLDSHTKVPSSTKGSVDIGRYIFGGRQEGGATFQSSSIRVLIYMHMGVVRE